jgi:hypothetical protein
LAEQVREADENDVLKEFVLDPFSGKSEKEDAYGFEMDEMGFRHSFVVSAYPH